MLSRKVSFVLFSLMLLGTLLASGHFAASADAPIGPVAYLPQSNGFNTIAYDTNSHSAVANIPMQAGLYFSVAVNPAGARAYITNDYIDSLVVIDTATNQQVTEIDLPAPGYPTGCDPRTVIVSDDNARVYVACDSGNRVYQIDAASNAIIGEIGVGFPTGLAISASGTELYVGSFFNNTLRMVDLTDPNFAQRVSSQVGLPKEVVRQPGSSLIYITHLPYDGITIYNPTQTVNHPAGRIVGQITVASINDIEFSPDGATLYITRQPPAGAPGEIVTFDTAQVVDNPEDVVIYGVGSAVSLPRPPTLLNLDSSAACLFIQDGSSIMELDMHSQQIARDTLIGGGLMALGRWLMPDPASQWVELAQNIFDANDNAGVAQIVVRRGCNSTGTVTVHYETSDDTAQAGVHYQASTGDITFNDGELSKTIEVPLIDDNAYHGERVFNIALSNPGGAALGNPVSAIVFIHETTPAADLAVDGQAEPNPVASGGQITYCYTLSNDGPSSAPTVTLTSTVQAGTAFVSAEIADCGGGGGGEFGPVTAAPGEASTAQTRTLLTSGCTTPTVGEMGTITCTWDLIDPYQYASVQVVLDVTASYGVVSHPVAVTSAVADPQPVNNATTLDVTVSSDVYISASGDCGGNLPCYTSLQQGLDSVGEDKTAYVLGGSYDEDAQVTSQRTALLSGDVTIGGSLSVYGGSVFISTPGTLTLGGSFYVDSGASFNPNGGLFVFSGPATQFLYSDVTFDHLTIASGARVDTSLYVVTVNGAFANQGVLVHADSGQYVSSSPTAFRDALGRNAAELTATGGVDLEYTTVWVVSGESPPACGGQAFPASPILRHFEVAPSVSGQATLRLAYDPSEANGLSPDDVAVYHCDGLQWEALAGPITHGSQNGMQFVELAGVSSFSPFALGGVAGVTPTPTETATPEPTPTATATPPAVTGQIETFVWDDLNGDGIQDAGEPGIGNVQVELLLASSGAVAAMQMTAADGVALFDPVAASQSYKLRYTLCSGCSFSPRDRGNDDTIDSDAKTNEGAFGTTARAFTVSAGQTVQAFDAAMRQPGVVTTFVWNDRNNDGLQDVGEEGVAAVQVELLDVANNLAVLATAQTDTQGLAAFAPVATGIDLRLRYTLCAGCSFAKRNQGADDTIDSDAKVNEGATGSTATFRLSQGSQGLNSIDAGMRLPGRVETFVWVDTNLNGLQDDGATGMAGVLVELLNVDDNNAVIATSTTGADGVAVFNEAPTSIRLKLRTTRPAGYLFTSRDQGNDDTVDSDARTNEGAVGTTVQYFRLLNGSQVYTDADAGLKPA